MGKERPKRLGEKLGVIRRQLELSQNEMIRRLGLSGKLTREEVSAYERGVREPSLPTLLRYADVARVWIDVLVDDDLRPVPMGSEEKGELCLAGPQLTPGLHTVRLDTSGWILLKMMAKPAAAVGEIEVVRAY